MIDLKSLIIGVLFGIAIVFSMGASNKKGKKEAPPTGMFQLVAIPNNDICFGHLTKKYNKETF